MKKINLNKKNKLRIRSKDELSKQMDGLLVLSKILDKTLNNWFLSGGTLLGAYRDKDFIPWDWDVEVTVFSEEAIKKEGFLLKKLLSAGFKIITSDSSLENFKIVAEGWGTEYEILGRYLKMPDYLRARLMTEVPARFFEKVEVLHFRGHKFLAPYPIDDFLTALYGDWKTPNKTADKKKYFSNDSYRLDKPSIFSKLKKNINTLFFPSHLAEFPSLQQKDLDQFYSWDKELGWCNQLNLTRVDKSDQLYISTEDKLGLTLFSTDEKGSRVCNYPSAFSDISLFGDEYSMCRDVHDNQTISWYLGKLRKTRVSNYGIYDYGLDQALLRLKRDYSKDPAKIVVLSVGLSTMARCVSVYKNYIDPSPVFMIKPRFIYSKKNYNSLILVEYPFSDKKDILKIKNYKYHFQKYDEHFRFWKNNRISKYTSHLLKKIARKRDNFQEDEKNIKKFKYEISFWKSHKYLFLGMMKYYKDLSKFYGFKPIFLLQHSKLSLEYCVTKSPDQIPWNDVISVATKKFPEINFLDESHIYDDSFMIKSLHGKNYHTPKANKIIAEFLNEKLKY